MNTQAQAPQTVSLDLEKGMKVDITKETGVSRVSFGLSWNANTGNQTADLDAFAVCLNAQGKLWKPSPESILYFKSPKNQDNKPAIVNGALVHSGDNLTGQGEGDDETIVCDTIKLPQDVNEVRFFVNIYKAQEKKQSFGMIKEPKIRLYDTDNPNNELVQYKLNESNSENFTGYCLGRFYRSGDGANWKFEALGQGANGTIENIVNQYAA